MKRTTSLILCLVLSISLFAQSRGMTFQVHNETLTSVLKKIEKAGEKNILFAYQATDQYRVTANIQAKRQKEALEMVLQGKPFSFVEHNTYFAVQYTGKTTRVEQIKGRVVDESSGDGAAREAFLLRRAQHLFCRSIHGQDNPGGTDQGQGGG